MRDGSLVVQTGSKVTATTIRHRCVEKEGLELGDLATKIFLNSKGKSDTLDFVVAAFLLYVDGKAAEGVFTKEVNEEVIRVKNHREPRQGYMTYAMELEMTKREARMKGKQEGREEGMEQKNAK